MDTAVLAAFGIKIAWLTYALMMNGNDDFTGKWNGLFY